MANALDMNAQPRNSNIASEIYVSQCQRILVVKLDSIGDFILATPFLRGLRKSAPKAEIDLVVSPTVFELAEICPFVNRVISAEVKHLPDNQLTITYGGNQSNIELHRVYCQEKNYDLALIPRYEDDYKLSSIVAAYSGAKRIVGFSLPEDRWATRHNYPELHHTDVVSSTSSSHEVINNDALLQYINGSSDIGPVDIWTLQENIVSIDETFRSLGISQTKPILAICPYSTDPRKLVPEDKLLSILQRVKELIPETQFLILGEDSERRYVKELKESLNNCFDLCNRTTARDTVAAISATTAVVSVDTDLAHIAAAVDKPSIVFFRHPADASSSSRYSPDRFRPWGKSECTILQPKHALWPCNLWPMKIGCQSEEPHCIISILDEEAVQTIVRTMQKQ